MLALKKIVNDTISLSLTQVISSLLSYLHYILIARYLGSQLLGTYIFTYSIIILLVYLSDIGLSTLIIREISKNRDRAKAILFNSLIIRFLLSLFIYTTLCFYIIVINPDDEVKAQLYLLLGLLLFSKTFLELFLSYCLGLEKHNHYGFIQLFTNIILLFCTYIFIILEQNVIIIGLAPFLASICGIIVGYKKNNLLEGVNYSFFILELRNLISQTIPLGIISFLTIFSNKIIIIIIGLLQTDAMVGNYSVSMKLIEGLLIFPIILGKIIFPIISVNMSQINKAQKLIQYILKLLFSIASFIIVFGIILSKSIILNIFSDSFSNSYDLFQILLWTLFPLFANNILGYIMFGLGKERKVLKILLFNILFSSILTYYFIIQYGIFGACYSNMISLLITFFSYLYYLSKEFYIYVIFSSLLKSIAIAFILILINNYLLNIFPNILSILFLLTLFLIFNWILGLFKSEDLKIVKKYLIY